MKCPRCEGTGRIHPRGETARNQRLKAKVSQVKIAGFMGISPQWLSDLELYRRPWSEARLALFNQAIQALKGVG